MEPKAKQLIIDNIPVLKLLADKFKSYQVVEIDLHRIIYFLTQFNSYEEIDIVIRLLKRIDFLSSERITYLLNNAYEQIDANVRKDAFVCQLGSMSDSSAVVCYQLMKRIYDSESQTLGNTITIDSLGRDIISGDPSSIIFFDDNITSGTQLREFFIELIEGKESAELVKIPLTAEQYEKLKKTPIKVCYAIQLSSSSSKVVEEIVERFEIDLKIYYGKLDDNNYLDFQSDTVNSEDEAEFAQKFIQEISKDLYSDKKWSKDTIYDRLLGYGNLGKLTAFYYNVPKSLIPVFWKFGYYKGKPWIPLFPETQEQKKIIEKNVEFDFITTEAINSWLNSAIDNRKPEVQLGFMNESGFSKEITVLIPTYSYVYNKFLSNIKIEEVQFEISKGSFFELNENETETEKYKEAISRYNTNILNYKAEVTKYLLRLATQNVVDIYLQNNGSKPATNCKVKLWYNTGQILIDDNENTLSLPKCEYKKPNIKQFGQFSHIEMISIPPISIFNPYERTYDPLDIDTDYYCEIFDVGRIGHKDRKSTEIEIILMEDAITIKLDYEIIYDEIPDVIKGVLAINFQKTESIDSKLELKMNKVITDINKQLK